MKTATTDELLDALSELRILFPNWRMGQLICNLTTASGCEGPESIWDIEDDKLLTAARRLIEGNANRLKDETSTD